MLITKSLQIIKKSYFPTQCLHGYFMIFNSVGIVYMYILHVDHNFDISFLADDPVTHKEDSLSHATWYTEICVEN